ncbi:cation:proton antiporter [Acholeplasma equirhinis]|uniref:cation:proton antiporter n=1 Tax=Acholeplasma equirhinis TaxID=555393 RepID=UPI00197AEE4E|nr:cation:proton antiporter [Acholeplasma equirhinis]MBN3489928.1 cation:proton antiporter [Acholeplasma equirhinis]
MDQIYLLIFKIGIVLAVGFIGAIIARKLKLPNVSGYLVLGLLLGPSLGLIFPGFKGIITIEENEGLNFISQIALAFIAFSIGAEFSIKAIKKVGKAVLVMTTTEVIGAVLVVLTVLFFLPKPEYIMPDGYNPFTNQNIAFGLILSAMAAATAPAATLMVMRQYRAYGPVTKAVLPITALDDIYGIVVFGFFISIAQSLVPLGEIPPVWLSIAKPFIEVFGSIIIGLIAGWVLSIIVNKFDKLRDDLQVIALVAVFLSVGGLTLLNGITEEWGISFSPLLANIMIGTTIANLAKKPEKTFGAINDFATPFYVIFFTLAGASLDLAILGSDPLILLLAGAFILARGFGKWSGIAVGANMVNAEPTVKKYLGIALLPQGGVSIGLLAIVFTQMPHMYKEISTIIMLSILVYETLGPLFAKFAIEKAGEINGLDRLEEISGLEGIEGE